MGQKKDDRTAADKVLRLFRILLSSDKKWYLPELAEHLNCSSQTVLRLSESIEREMGESLQTGKEGKYRWYRLVPKSRPGRLPWDKKELRLLEICQDLTEPFMFKSSLDVAERDFLNFQRKYSSSSKTLCLSRFAPSFRYKYASAPKLVSA